MGRRRRRLWAIAAGMILFILGLALGHQYLTTRLPLVGVIQWSDQNGVYGENLEGVKEGLREEGYQNGLNLELKVIDAHEDRSRVAAAAQVFQAQGARVLITLGTVATQVALEVIREDRLPLVYSMVAAPRATGLARPEDPGKICFTGTSMEVPAVEQLRFLLLARPGLQRLGILYCTATPQAVATGEAAIAACAELALLPIWRTVTDGRPELLHQAIDDLTRQKIQALFLPADPVLSRPGSLKIICDVADWARVPVMVPAGSLAAQGGLLAYHCDFTDIGRQSGRQAARLLSGVPVDKVPPESPRIKRLTLNIKAAQKLHLALPRQILSQAHDIYQ